MKTQLFTLLFIGFFSFSSAQECSKELGLVNSLLEKANLEQALTNPDAIADDFNELKSSLGSIGLSSLKKDAPKLLFLNGKQQRAKLKMGDRRIYVTSLISKETIDITFSNPSLLHGTEIIICSHATNGQTENLIHFMIDDENALEQVPFTLTDVKGKVVSISVKNINSNERFEFGIAAN
ncbi:MAG: hypothetical protein WDZ45_06145 [Flavobacteriaceae bacterium]